MFCDQKTAGGGWTVFQKRLDGSVDFYRGWTDYKHGFGNLNGEFWLGLDKIHRLTKTKNKLRVDLEDTTGKTVYAEYDMFAVTSERTKYQLSLGTFIQVKICRKGPLASVSFVKFCFAGSLVFPRSSVIKNLLLIDGLTKRFGIFEYRSP